MLCASMISLSLQMNTWLVTSRIQLKWSSGFVIWKGSGSISVWTVNIIGSITWLTYIHTHIRTIIRKFEMAEAWWVAMQMAMKLHTRKAKKEAGNQTIKQSINQNLMCVMTASWPNTAHPIGGHSQYNYDPTNKCKVSLKRELGYHNDTNNCWLHLGCALRLAHRWDAKREVGCYVNLDYAGWSDDDN